MTAPIEQKVPPRDSTNQLTIDEVLSHIPRVVYDALQTRGLTHFRPSQHKSILAGLFTSQNLLVCTPTASGKTLIGEMAMLNHIAQGKKALYVVPLKALATEKFHEFTKRNPSIRVARSIGDTDSAEEYLGTYDLIVTTTEKVDSLLRHRSPWFSQIGVVVVDEIHLLNDVSRGPTVEIVITILREILPKLQIIGLSATIGNAPELAHWLSANLVVDMWRPVALHHGVIVDNEVFFHRTQD